jgi:hypothetical protein
MMPLSASTLNVSILSPVRPAPWARDSRLHVNPGHPAAYKRQDFNILLSLLHVQATISILQRLSGGYRIKRREFVMRTIMLSLAAASLAIPAVVAFPASQAEARDHRYKEWRGRDGRMYCRKSDGTVGLVVGGVAGALVGRSIDTRGDRATGTILGAAAGALLGKEIDSKRRCR